MPRWRHQWGTGGHQTGPEPSLSDAESPGLVGVYEGQQGQVSFAAEEEAPQQAPAAHPRWGPPVCSMGVCRSGCLSEPAPRTTAQAAGPVTHGETHASLGREDLAKRQHRKDTVSLKASLRCLAETK